MPSSGTGGGTDMADTRSVVWFEIYSDDTSLIFLARWLNIIFLFKAGLTPKNFQEANDYRASVAR